MSQILYPENSSTVSTIAPCLDPLTQIIATCTVVADKAKSVKIHESAIDVVAAELCKDALSYREGVVWDYGGWHYAADTATFGPVTCQYIFVMDALNFCFWPTKDLEYDHLAVGLRKVLEADISAFDASKLAVMTPEILQSWFAYTGFTLPLIEERVMRLRELGAALLEEYDGLAANMVKKANNSAARLVQLLLRSVPGFRDTAIYEGRLVHIYKRVQILVGDIWAAYGKATTKTLPDGATNSYYFYDLDKVTMFADYRIPQLLRNMKILEYSADLSKRIDSYEEIMFGSQEEVEIRTCTVMAVEKLKAVCNRILRENAAAAGVTSPRPLLSIELDWLLWNQGELCKDEILPHHRTLTIYY